jgi:EpsD family peptidyl-prolyl cis-trans isomerase
MPNMPCRNAICVNLLLFVVALAGGCDVQDRPKPASQVAANVNGDEVTVHQLNQVLAGTPGIEPDRAAQAKREILERLIDRQLVERQAIEKKLDRAPGVMQAIDAARSEILAQAYRERVAAAQAEPTAEEVAKYYAEHPELFAQRRVFDLEEIVVQAQADLAGALREQAMKSRSMQEVAAWLGSQGAKFTENRGVRAAEYLSNNFLSTLQAMKPGEIRVIESGGRAHVFRLQASQPAPVDQPSVAPRIRQFLFNQRLARALDVDVAELRKRSKIEYIGEFAKPAANAAEAAPVAGAKAPVAGAKAPVAGAKAPVAGAKAPEPSAPDVQKAVRALR